MQNIRYVFFDVGYTLVNEDEVWALRCREQAETQEAKELGLSARQIYDEIVRASMAYQPQYRTVIKKFGFSQPAPYRHDREKLYPDTIPVLRALSERYRLGVIANQTGGLDERLKALQIAEYFSLVLSSWEYQIMKPDPRFFQIALERAGCAASEAVMIGDRLDNDICPAKAVGIQTIWIRQGFGGLQAPKSDAYRPDAEIGCLSELLRLL